MFNESAVSTAGMIFANFQNYSLINLKKIKLVFELVVLKCFYKAWVLKSLWNGKSLNACYAFLTSM